MDASGDVVIWTFGSQIGRETQDPHATTACGAPAEAAEKRNAHTGEKYPKSTMPSAILRASRSDCATGPCEPRPYKVWGVGGSGAGFRRRPRWKIRRPRATRAAVEPRSFAR